MNKHLISPTHQKRLNSISAYLRELRLNENMTQQEVSMNLNLHKNTIFRVENGMNVTLVTLFEIADFYNIPINEIFMDVV